MVTCVGCFDVLQKKDSRTGFGEARTCCLSLTPSREARGIATVLEKEIKQDVKYCLRSSLSLLERKKKTRWVRQKVMSHLSNICLMTRKQKAMGIEAQRSFGLGKTTSSWSVRSAQPCPSGNQIQSAHIISFNQDSILHKNRERRFIIVFLFFLQKEIKKY